MSTLFLSL